MSECGRPPADTLPLHSVASSKRVTRKNATHETFLSNPITRAAQEAARARALQAAKTVLEAEEMEQRAAEALRKAMAQAESDLKARAAAAGVAAQ